ncbi:restriction endonuclease subunit S [Vibrio parahaemolyticus]|uniref:restriction endonuclease subunit S n=1 Tax=Vibrio parahaemolyticus TaxID=670 RepID=UPI00146AC6E9|nr:restriction endonuclease subunit S [Vibrio parahaemolyticus]MDF5166292.1 restriction endonuclease subunit S [Vibrio parahaemolyticus]MDF5172610.1 restriction endonuclease subunit S [Vibrio parahaemolyticus]MDF5678434.1 restriction endonuclease subunit S [Vibrio parahaemolyticus]NMS39149.1 restriction endonuclease subunit S [Vibrio parahaemolyticus]NMU11749.1 restriction endonuclease subunit S [Vibrio parahaemolyticus]
MVPNGWKLTSLGEVCSGNLQTGPFGSQLHAHEYTDEGVPVLMPKDLINYRTNNVTAAKIPEHRADDLKKHVLKSGDLLFSRRGDVARFALIESDYPRSLCGTGCLKATPNKAHSPLFLSYFLQKNAVKKWLEQNAVGQTMPNMNTAILAELPIMVASSKEEEDKIAQILSTWDKAIATTEKLIKTSKQQKKALMQQLLTGKKRLVNPETGKAFEGGWEEVRAGNVFLTRSNKKHNSDLPILAITQDKGAIPRELIDYNVSVTNDSISGYKVVEQGDFIISLRSFQGGIEYSKYKGICSPAYVILYPKIEIVDAFYKYHLKSHPFIQAMKSRLEGIRDGKIISYKYFAEIKLPQPSLKEQQKIASVLTAADKEIKVLEAKLAHFKQEKKALMQQLLTGKRRVTLE